MGAASTLSEAYKECVLSCQGTRRECWSICLSASGRCENSCPTTSIATTSSSTTTSSTSATSATSTAASLAGLSALSAAASSTGMSTSPEANAAITSDIIIPGAFLTGEEVGWLDMLWQSAGDQCSAAALHCEAICTSRFDGCLNSAAASAAASSTSEDPTKASSRAGPLACACEWARVDCTTQCGRGLASCWEALWATASARCRSKCAAENGLCEMRCSARYETCYATVLIMAGQARWV